MEIVHRAISVEAHAFMMFLGLYLAEGSLGSHLLSISQSPNGARRDEIEMILGATGMKFTQQKNGVYQFSSRQLCAFMESLGFNQMDAATKFVPARFKDFSPDLLMDFLHGYALGDGNWHGRTGQLTFGTSSPRLAGDVQELLIKCGKMANIRVDRVKGTRGIGGYLRNSDMNIVSVREKKMDYSLDKRVIRKEDYSGLIWDVEVEDWHTMLVRRHGKPFFSGNCNLVTQPSRSTWKGS